MPRVFLLAATSAAILVTCGLLILGRGVSQPRGAPATARVADGREPVGGPLSEAPVSADHVTAARPHGQVARGVVSGPHGPVQDATVVARRVGMTTDCGQTRSSAKGAYVIELPSAIEAYWIDLTAKPPEGSGLMPGCVLGLRVHPGEDVEHNFRVFRLGRVIDGRLVGCDNRPICDARMWSVPSSSVADLLRPSALLEQWDLTDALDGAADTAVTDDQGRFQFLGLAPGPHRLFVDRGPWTLAAPVEAWAGTGDLTLQAVPRPRSLYVVIDLETEQLIPDAVVKLVPLPEGVDPRAWKEHYREWERRHITEHYHFHFAMDPHLQPWVGVSASAPGYETFRLDRPLKMDLRNVPLALGLLRPRPTNVQLDVSYDDGAPFQGALTAAIHRPGRTALGAIESVGSRPSVGLPPGSWVLHVWSAAAGMPDVRTLTIDVPAAGMSRATITLLRGGTLVLRLPEEPRSLDWVATLLLERAGRLRGRSFFLARREATIEDLMPGSWRVVVRRGTTAVVDRTVVLKAGSCETVVVE